MDLKEIADRLWRSASSTWLPKLGDLAPDVRRAAVQAIGNLSDPRGLEHVLPCLADGEPAVRVAAAQALERLGTVCASHDLVAPLVHALHDVNDGVVQSARLALLAVVEASRDRRDQRTVKPLTTHLVDESPVVRAAVAEALAFVAGDDITAALLESLADREPRVQAAANQALLTRGDPRPRERLLAVLPTGDPELWPSALDVLVRDDAYDFKTCVALLKAVARPGTSAQATAVRKALVRYFSSAPGRLEWHIFECQALDMDIPRVLARLIAGMPETRPLLEAALRVWDELEESARDQTPFPRYDEEAWSAARKAAEEAIRASRAFPRPVRPE